MQALGMQQAYSAVLQPAAGGGGMPAGVAASSPSGGMPGMVNAMHWPYMTPMQAQQQQYGQQYGQQQQQQVQQQQQQQVQQLLQPSPQGQLLNGYAQQQQGVMHTPGGSVMLSQAPAGAAAAGRKLA